MTDLKRNLFTFIVAFTFGLVSLSATNAFAIETQSDWDTSFAKYFSDQDPILDITDANTGAVLSWQAHYWLRAYVTMARAFKDTKYLDKSVTLIDFLLDNRDKVRYAGGKIDVSTDPYYSAPLYFLNHRDAASPGWRLWVNNDHWRIQTLDDGHITHSIMRFVDLVYNNPDFSSYQTKAVQYLAAVEEIVLSHDEVFAYNLVQGIPGSYYYPNPDGTGLYTGTVPFNHNATMGVTLLLLDKAKGTTVHRSKAQAILGHLKNSLRLQSNDSYVWDYHPQKPDKGIEDISHAHMDISFVLLAYKQGLDVTEQDMKRFANTLTKNMYLGNGDVAYSVDGLEPNSSGRYYPVGYDWIDLAEFDPSILDIAKEVYNKYYSNPSWSRPFQGWAEILWWTKQLAKPSPPQNLKVIDSSAD